MSNDAPPVYSEYTPDASLARHVECYWTFSGRRDGTTPQRGRVLPDGCADILFSLGDAPTGAHTDHGDALVIGTMTRPVHVVYRGRVDLVAVRFRPGGAAGFLGAPLDDLTDQAAPLEALWGSGERAELRERLGEEGARPARVACLEGALLARRERAFAATDRVALHACELVTRSGGRVGVDTMARAVGLGRRQLERRFRASVGVSPKVACRVARFRGTVNRLYADHGTSLSRVALDAGYADQAHMTREFRALAGSTPAAYRRGAPPAG